LVHRYYQNCWDITITDAQGGLKTKGPVIKTPKTTPKGTCFRVDGKTHLTAMYGALVTGATTALEPVSPTIGAGGTVNIAPPDSVGTKPEDKPGCLTYTVVKGDGLAKIAARFDIANYKEIYALNKDKMADEDTLNIGQVLLMPGDCDPTGPTVTGGGPAAATVAFVPLLAAVALVAVLVR
jgi:nucleoid-associated protein YgaU